MAVFEVAVSSGALHGVERPSARRVGGALRNLVRESLGAEDQCQVKVLGVVAVGFRGGDRDAQVVTSDGEDVAVKGDEPDVGMVDDLAAGLPARIGELRCLPELDEAGARSAQLADHGAKSVVAWITTGGHAEGGDEACLERRALGRGVHRAASGADQVAQCFDDRCRRCGGAPLFEAGQVVDRDAGESRQLLASQAGRPTPAAGRHAYRGGVDTVAPAPQGVANVHASTPPVCRPRRRLSWHWQSYDNQTAT